MRDGSTLRIVLANKIWAANTHVTKPALRKDAIEILPCDPCSADIFIFSDVLHCSLHRHQT